MKAVIAARAGGPEVLELDDRDDPVPGPHQVLVRVAHAGVNFADVVMRHSGSAGLFPFVPGVEGAGVVVALGDGVTLVDEGQRVSWAPVKLGASVGSYAELALVEEEQVLPLPEDVTLELAAAATLQGLTAHYLVHDVHPVAPGTTVLVHAGAGGTGRMVVQWLHALGATVFATVGNDEKAKVAREAGADHAIVYTAVDFADEVRLLSDGRGVDYVVDGVVAGTFRGDIRAVADRGHICVFGRAGGVPEPFSPMELMQRSITVTGGYMSNYLRDRAEVLRKADDVWRGVREGWLAPLVHGVLPLADASTAHRLLETRETVGKLVLEVTAR